MKDHIWWFNFDDINNKLIASKKNQLIEPFISVSTAKYFEEIFRESLVIELMWEDKIEYEINNEIRKDKFVKTSFFTYYCKYFQKKYY